MKYIDKFLKILKTDRNTFATYVLTLLSVYLSVDRIVEMLLMIFTGVSYSYWGPIKYTLALACVAFAYAFSPSSKYSTSKARKVTLFYVYTMAKYGSLVVTIICSKICRFNFKFFGIDNTCNGKYFFVPTTCNCISIL